LNYGIPLFLIGIATLVTLQIQTAFAFNIPNTIQTARAISLSKAIAQSKPGDDFLLQARNKHKKGDLQGAIKDYTAVIAINPKSVQAYTERGTVYEHLKDYPKAIADCSKAIDLNPQYLDAYVQRAFSYEGLKDYDNAIVDFTMAMLLNSEDGNIYVARGIAYAYKGDNFQAKDNMLAGAKLFKKQGKMSRYREVMQMIEQLFPRQ
jgi:tetratricopeptide (TPR) repeat protein